MLDILNTSNKLQLKPENISAVNRLSRSNLVSLTGGNSITSIPQLVENFFVRRINNDCVYCSKRELKNIDFNF